jgi:hypothetical protein
MEQLAMFSQLVPLGCAGTQSLINHFSPSNFWGMSSQANF